MEKCCAREQTSPCSPRLLSQDSWQSIPQLSPMPHLSLTDVLHEAPRLLELVSPDDKKAMLSVCASIRRVVHAFATWVVLQEGNFLQHLLDSAVGPRLQVLQLQDIRLTATAVTGLTSAPWSSLLTSLTLANCGLNSLKIRRLAAGNWPMLQHLSFTDNMLGTAAIQAMAGGKWPCLDHLDLSSNSLSAVAISQLTRLGWTRLSGLELHDNPDMDANAFRRLALGSWPCLKGLGISGTFTLESFTTESASAWPLLKSVYLDCHYCPAQVISFAGVRQSLRNLQVKTREPLRRGRLPKPAMLELAQTDWPNLQSLDLSYSHLGGECLAQLALGDWPQLNSLDVSHLPLTQEQILPGDYAGFASGHWPRLTYLCLSHNRMDDECAAKLICANWRKLQILDLSYNDIGATGSAFLAHGNWPKMKHLCVHGNKPKCTCSYCVSQEEL